VNPYEAKVHLHYSGLRLRDDYFLRVTFFLAGFRRAWAAALGLGEGRRRRGRGRSLSASIDRAFRVLLQIAAAQGKAQQVDGADDEEDREPAIMYAECIGGASWSSMADSFDYGLPAPQGAQHRMGISG
jgi:hypothetical protein